MNYTYFFIYIIFLLYFILYKPIHENFKVYENFKEIKPHFPIDVVYTWAGENTTSNIRLSDNFELKYSLRSIFKYADWVNHIYIIMNPPKKHPSWFKDIKYKKITILDHNEVYRSKKYLPTTNSNSIETVMHNIPNLSEHFIYFNDDFFLGNYVNYLDFFTKEGKVVASHIILNNRSMLKKNMNDILKFKYPKMGKFYKHIPIPFLKSQIKDFIREYPEYIKWIKNTKTRTDIGCDICVENNLNCPCQQIHIPILLHMYKNGYVKIKYHKRYFDYIYMNNKKLYRLKLISKFKPKFFCINDVQKNLIKKLRGRKIIVSFFQKYYEKNLNYENDHNF